MHQHRKFKSHPLRDLRAGIHNAGREIGQVREYDRSAAWIEVGAGSGAPAFQNSWTNFGVNDVVCRFQRSSSGIVYVQGTLLGGAASTLVFTLPEGYRPYRSAHFPMLVSIAGVIQPGWCYAQAAGGVGVVWNAAGALTFCSLNSIIFPAEL
jgi:hypothetical protein